MTARALLVGSQVHGLLGCEADVALLRDVLGRLGFAAADIAVRTGDQATRAGILDGLAALVGSTQPGDAVLVYYSGHGGRQVRPDVEARKAAGLDPQYQFIVPTDIDQSTDDDFRGILSEELTAWQRRLTDATPNVTTILDCCHSGNMARDTGLVPKALPTEVLRRDSFSSRGLAAHAAKVVAPVPVGGADTNALAVRVVACQPEQSAFERDTDAGRHGILTQTLVGVLDELAGRRVSWALVGEIVRRRVLDIAASQRPEIEGPANRFVLSVDEDRSGNALPVTQQGDAYVIEGAPLLGVSVGDQFDLQVAGEDGVVADAEVTSIVGSDAVLDVHVHDGAQPAGAPLPAGLRANPTRTALPKRAVVVDVSGPAGDAVRATIAASVGLVVAAGPPALASVVADGDRLAVVDEMGARLRTTSDTNDEAGRRKVLELIELADKAEVMRRLSSGVGAAELPAPVEVLFRQVVPATPEHPDGRVELARSGARFAAGNKASVVIRNRSDERVYAWVFDIGVSRRVHILTNAALSGTLLEPAGHPNDTKVLWGDAGGELSWPSDVPADGTERPETFLVLLADRQQDLSSLETPKGARGLDPAVPAPVRSPLDVVLDQYRFRTREAPQEGTGAVPLRYRVERIEFFLQPQA